METAVLVFSANDGFALLLGVALCSIFENKKGGYVIDVFVIDGGIAVKNKERLGILEKRYGFKIIYVVPDKNLFAGIRPANTPIELPIETYYRLCVASVLPAGCQKAIYLDCDVMVRGDIREFFQMDLAGRTLGAVEDHSNPVALREHLRKLCGNTLGIAMPPEAAYFNAGVLLLDLSRWRKFGMEEKLFRFIRENQDELIYHDNDALNAVLLDDWKKLPMKYNLLAEHAGNRSGINPLIVHFAGGGKPWYLLSALPYQPEYVYYADKTPWKNEKYRKIMDVPFAKKYHIYPVAWAIWSFYKKIRRYFSG